MFIELTVNGKKWFLNVHRIVSLAVPTKDGTLIDVGHDTYIMADNPYDEVKEKIARALNGKFLVRYRKDFDATVHEEIIIADCRTTALDLFMEKHSSRDLIDILSCFEIKQEVE